MNIAAAEWLIDNGYTSREKLTIGGGSNGGLLVAACAVQRPDLFAVCLPNVGVLDMLRFHKFTIGWGWTSDYGSPDDPDEFQALLAYSPYHNLKSGTAYPATLVTTADHDDRVYPAHSFKFTAALQAAHQGENPVLIRIETKAGHGLGKPTAKVIEQTADRWAFLSFMASSPSRKRNIRLARHACGRPDPRGSSSMPARPLSIGPRSRSLPAVLALPLPLAGARLSGPPRSRW